MRAVDQPFSCDEADAGTGEVELAVAVDARHLGALAAENRTAGLTADRGGAFDELDDIGELQPVGGDVVEEEERVGAGREDVVDAVGREIGTRPPEPAGAALEDDLRSDTVRRGREEAGVVERVQAREAPQAADHRIRPSRADSRGQALDHRFGLREGDARLLVGVLRHGTYPNERDSTACTIPRPQMLTVQDIVAMSALGLDAAAGSEGLGREVRWLHASELPDPTPWMSGGELLLTTGLGMGTSTRSQKAYLRRLSERGVAALGFGLGFGHDEVPEAIVGEANRLGFPILTVPYEVPFIAISKAVFSHLASEQLESVTQALEVHERLAQAIVHGRGLQALLAILCNHLNCSLALVDENGRVLAERHARKRLSFEDGIELPVLADDEMATLRAARERVEFGEYDLLVLHHGQTALAFELSKRHAVSAAELRLAGDLLDDLEHERLSERETARRMAAFGLEPSRDYAALLAVPINGLTAERLRLSVARTLDRRAVRYLSTARRDKAAFLVEAASEEAVLALARKIVDGEPGTRISIGRPGQGRALGRSLLEARAALDASTLPVASYHDLGSLELLLNLPDAALEAFVDRVLGRAADNAWLIESLTALLESGCRWSEAADRLGVHRHTLRYRMERLREQTGRHPDDPEQRMELWLAVKASQALAARRERAPV